MAASTNFIPPSDAQHTDDASAWVKRALDPFHDVGLRQAGLPDDDNTPTVVQTIKRSFNISNPQPNPVAANWSCAIFSSSFLSEIRTYPMQAYQGTMNMIGLLPVPSGSAVFGPAYGGEASVFQTKADPAILTENIDMGTINIHSWHTDQTQFFPDVGAGTYVLPTASEVISPFRTTDVGGSNDNFTSRMRLISCGFEVVNTTAPLAVQGLVTVSRLPSRERVAYCPTIVNFGAAQAITNGGMPATQMSMGYPTTGATTIVGGPPATLEEALAYPETKQWAAKDGCYCTLTQQCSRNPLRVAAFSQIAVMNSDHVNRNEGQVVPNGFASGSTAFLSTNSTFVPQRSEYVQTCPFDVSSAIFTGLSSSTTLTVNVVFVVEIAPRIDDQRFGQLVYNATPSPSWQPDALLAYERAARLLPPGVPRSMNPFGEYWEMVKGILRAAAPSIISTGAELVGKLIERRPAGSSSAPRARAVRSLPRAERPVPRSLSRASSRASSAASRTSRASSRSALKSKSQKRKGRRLKFAVKK